MYGVTNGRAKLKKELEQGIVDKDERKQKKKTDVRMMNVSKEMKMQHEGQSSE